MPSEYLISRHWWNQVDGTKFDHIHCRVWFYKLFMSRDVIFLDWVTCWISLESTSLSFQDADFRFSEVVFGNTDRPDSVVLMVNLVNEGTVRFFGCAKFRFNVDIASNDASRQWRIFKNDSGMTVSNGFPSKTRVMISFQFGWFIMKLYLQRRTTISSSSFNGFRFPRFRFW